VGDFIKTYLNEMGIFWESVKREALNRLGWKRTELSRVDLRRLGAAVIC